MRLLNRYNVDLMTYAEHGLNMARLPLSKTFDSLFDYRDRFAFHNSFENP